jgi:hypothetical protein
MFFLVKIISFYSLFSSEEFVYALHNEEQLKSS